MNANHVSVIAAGIVAAGLLLVACSSGGSDFIYDDSMYLTGTEELPVPEEDGHQEEKANNGKRQNASNSGNGDKSKEKRGGKPTCREAKVLLCHIPAGNPEKPVTICISAQGVDAHKEQHQDTEGACDTVAPTPASDVGKADSARAGDLQ